METRENDSTGHGNYMVNPLRDVTTYEKRDLNKQI